MKTFGFILLASIEMLPLAYREHCEGKGPENLSEIFPFQNFQMAN